VFEFFGRDGRFLGERVRDHVGRGRSFYDFDFDAHWLRGGVHRIEYCVLTNVRRDAACASRWRP